MSVDEKGFFREATLRICGRLEIEKALWLCLLYLRDYIPAEEAALLYYSPSLGTVTLYATASSDGGEFVNLQTAYPPELRAVIEADEYPEAYIANRADEHPIVKPILKAMGRGRSSVMLVRLIVERDLVGTVCLWAEGWDRFSEEHLRLLSLLKKPFAIALSNSRRYREELKKYVCKNPWGNVYPGVYLDPGFAEVRQILAAAMKRLAVAGADGIHVQRLFPMPMDFNPDLKANPDRGPWEGTLKCLDEILKQCRSANPA